MLSNLPRDVAEDVLSRLPVTSLRRVRFTSKKWNKISKKRSFKKKHIASAAAAAVEKEFMAVMMLDYGIHLMSFNIHGSIHDLSVSHQAKLVSLTDSDQMMKIYKVYHCDGLLLCPIGDQDCRFVVWNPYLGQTRWFQPPNPINTPMYAIGYENTKSCGCIHKVMRFIKTSECGRRIRYELYYLNSKDTTTFPITYLPNWEIEFYANGVSVKGNTYWYAKQNRDIPPDANDDYFESEDYKSREAFLEFERLDDFLICFDFTTERFGPRLRLPFHSYSCEDTITLSSVRDEQLAVLFQLDEVWNMEIWITTKIETQMLSWSIFLRVDMMNPQSGCRFPLEASSFFVNEEKKVAMVIKNDARRSVACIVGEDAYFRKVDMGISAKIASKPLLCPYVPSSVQITKPPPPVSKSLMCSRQ